MALASPYSYKPYAPPKTTGLAQLLGSYGPDGGSQPPAIQPQAAAPTAPTAGLTPINNSIDTAEGINMTRGQVGRPYTGAGAPATGPSVPATSSQSSSTGGGGGGGGYDFSGDPILAQIRALNQKLVADAEASALAGRKQNEITFGFDPSMHYEDKATEMAARQNAFSTLAQLLSGHNQRAQATDENANKANLYYSSARAGAVRGEGKQYTLQQSLGNQDFQGKMSQIAQALLDVKNQAQEREIEAEQAAYERALAYGGGGSGGGGGGGGGGLQWTSGAQDLLRQQGYSAEDIAKIVSGAMQAHGWTDYGANHNEAPQVMQNGQIFSDNNGRYIRVKVGTPGGNSTENVYLP